MFKGICTKCGRKCYGWALQSEERRVCHHCGGKLRVVQESNANVSTTQKDRKKAHASR